MEGSSALIRSRLHRRLANLAGCAIVAGLIGYALFAQHVLGLEACPLCIFQRVAYIAGGAVFLAAALHAPRNARFYGLAALVANAVGGAIAARHVYIQNLPADQVPACGPGLDYLMDAFPLMDTLRLVLTGSGECADVVWSFLGLSMPAWALVWFVLLGALAVVANWSFVPRASVFRRRRFR